MDDFFDDVADLRRRAARRGRGRRARPAPADCSRTPTTERDRAAASGWRTGRCAHEAQPGRQGPRADQLPHGGLPPGRQHWTNERVVVFTEYRDTQRWLAEPAAPGGAGRRPRGAAARRHATPTSASSCGWRSRRDPTEHPVRILLATDAASEGIDLQNHCHRLVNYDIPFNPNKLEQRIGRIDRYGQTHDPGHPALRRHRLGARRRLVRGRPGVPVPGRQARSRGWRRTSARSTPCWPTPCSAGCSGEIADFDVDGRRRRHAAVRRLPRRDVRRAGRAAARATSTTPSTSSASRRPSVKRVVDTALELARQQPLRPHVDERHPTTGLYDVPPLTGSWERATAGLTEKLRAPGRAAAPAARHLRRRPSRAGPRRRRARPPQPPARRDVHPAAARCGVQLPSIGLHRVTAVVSDDPALEDVLVGAYSRFVLVGADGVRLHEEVLLRRRLGCPRAAGSAAGEPGRARRLLDRALAARHAGVRRRCRPGWSSAGRGRATVCCRDRLARQHPPASRWSASSPQRRRPSRSGSSRNLDQFAATLRGALAEPTEDEDALFSRVEAARTRRRARAVPARPAVLGGAAGRAGRRTRPRARRRSRPATRDPQPHRFPVAVVFVVPKREAIR